MSHHSDDRRPAPALDYRGPTAPTHRDIRRATAVTVAMVSGVYAIMGVLYLYYISRGVPLPAGGSWRWYTFGVAVALLPFAFVSLRQPVVGAVGALVVFFAVNMASIVQDPGSIVNGAIIKVLAFIMLIRATMQALEARKQSGGGAR